MNHKPSIRDYIDLDLLEVLLTEYSHIYQNVCLSIVDLEEKILIAINFQEICKMYHRKHPETEKRCIESNEIITDLTRKNGYTEYKCKNGLLDIAIPINMDGVHVATLYTGQIFIKNEINPLESDFREQAKKFGFDEEKYIAAFKKVPTFTRTEIDELVSKVFNEIIHLLTH